MQAKNTKGVLNTLPHAVHIQEKENIIFKCRIEKGN